MNKKIIWIVVSLLCVLVLLGCAEPSPTPTTVKTVKVGFLMPLSGPTAMWGLPGLTGVNLYVDEVNAAGGIKVGDERYLLEIVKYDSEGVPSIALLGARKLVLEDNVSMIIQPTGAEVTAVAPFATEQEMLVMGVCSDEVGPDLPYYLGVSENYPWYHGVSIQYIADNYPEVKRVAATVQDEKTGQHSMAWVMAGFEANDFDIVYSKFFGVDTTDFAPIASAILATNPDLISLCAMWPEYRALLLQELYLQGYTGMLESSEWEVTDILAVVPTEFMDGAVAHYPFITAPVLPPACHQFYEDWMARYGPGGPEDVHREIHSVDWNASIALRIWVWGVEQAGTIDPTSVRDTLLASPEIPHFFGPAYWWGDDLVGCNQVLLSPQYITELQNGETVTVAEYNISEWYEENKEYVEKYYEMYHLKR